MSPARRAAFAVVRRVFEHGAYADRAFHAEARGLDTRDRALAQAIAYAAVQRRLTLDHIASTLTGRTPEKLEPVVRAGLRVGLVQLLYLDGVGAHAAVNESVELVKPTSPNGARLVNAVLRRAAAEGSALLAPLHDRDPLAAAVCHSVPEWLAEMWFAELGPDAARALLAGANRPAESALRANLLVASADEVRARLPVASHPAPGLPEGLVLDAPFDAHGSPLWREGAIMPQSRGSMQVCREIDPQPGERILDLCAAPGAKTTHLAAMSANGATIVAVEKNPRRAAALRDTCRRMRARVDVVVADAASWESPARFDRVLVDPPCSGLGTLQSRPDVRWRASPESIEQLAELQAAILDRALAAVRPGGLLTYSVCTICGREGEELVRRRVARARPELVIEHTTQLLPGCDGADGFFIARMRRRAD